MQKLVLISILLMTVIVPALAARERNPRLALKKMLAWTLIGVAVYVVFLLLLYPRLF